MKATTLPSGQRTCGPSRQHLRGGDDRLCWSTITGLLLIHVGGDATLLSDLWAVRSIRLQHRYYPAVAVGVGLVLPAIIAAQWGDPGGGLLVAGFLRAAVLLQATFCVNSLAHLVGTRRYDAGSSARDSVLTALVTFGEGY